MARKGSNEHPGPGKASGTGSKDAQVRGSSDQGDGGFETGRWTRGYVGGEWGEDNQGGGRFGEQDDWDGDEGKLTHEDDVFGGSWGELPIAHSGISDHFKKEEYLRAGHNTGPGCPSDGWTGQSGPAQPEKSWGTGPQGREEENEKPNPPVKIPGGGSRPF